MFESIEDYPFLETLCAGWRDVRHELEELGETGFMEWPERDIYAGNWSVFPFYRFGDRVAPTCAVCLRTAGLIESVPGMVTAGFSRMAPGTHIKPHTGYTGDVLRFHLGLTQAEDCGLRVGTEMRSWHPGSAFVFDDTQEHEAWNRGPATRVVLLLDFKRAADLDIAVPEHLRHISFGD